jgi:hypothetical protein
MVKRCYECKQGAQDEDYDDDVVKCIIRDPKTGRVHKIVNLCRSHRFDGEFVWDGYLIEEVPKNAVVRTVVKKSKPSTNFEIGSPGWKILMDAIVTYWTGWESLDQMCANNPTLMVSKHSSDLERVAIHKMRAAYKFVNGREAYPPNIEG